MAEKDIIKIALATDCHLGYLERDPIRHEDSFRAFEEILCKAKEEDVDLILLGGDLFHDNKPSRETMMGTMRLLRKHCMGSRPCPLQILSHQHIHFPETKTVNYMDPNYNVSMPIFSIHGNHDDPSGVESLCALHLLAIANFVNYFGQAKQPDDIQLKPICIQKGNIRDERLHRTFIKKKVSWHIPDVYSNDWFNLFVLHQNRVKRSERNYIPESFIPNNIHLTFWGHEHKCEIDPVPKESCSYITQPGSSVATSLSEGEAVRKHMGILEIRPNKEFRIRKIPLKTVRAFKFLDVILSEHLDPDATSERDVEEFLFTKVQELLEELHHELSVELEQPVSDSGESSSQIRLPLIRIRVEYTGYPSLSNQRFGQRFAEHVANPRDILLFYRKRSYRPRSTQHLGEAPPEMPEPLDQDSIEDLVIRLISQSPDPPHLIKFKQFQEAMKLFVDKDESEAIRRLIHARSLLAALSYKISFRFPILDKLFTAYARVFTFSLIEFRLKTYIDREEKHETSLTNLPDDELVNDPGSPLPEQSLRQSEEKEEVVQQKVERLQKKSKKKQSIREKGLQLSFQTSRQARDETVLQTHCRQGKTRQRLDSSFQNSTNKTKKQQAASERYHDNDEDDDDDYMDADRQNGEQTSSDIATSDGEVLHELTNVSDTADYSQSPQNRSVRRAAMMAQKRVNNILQLDNSNDNFDFDDDSNDDDDDDDGMNRARDYPVQNERKRHKRR
eukprot:gene10148-2312_t